MPSTHLVYRVLTLSVLVCVCSSTAVASFGTVHGTTDATTGCFPSVDSIEEGEVVGGVVDVKMLLCFTGSVAIEGPGYRGNATLGDGHHSGHVTVHLNTAVTDSAVFNVTSDRLDSVPMNATANGSFEPGTYTVTIRDGSGDVADTVTFGLGELPSRTPNATRDDLTVYRASNASFQSVASIEEAISNDTVEPASTVAVGDTLVVAIESERLADAMNSTNGSTTARFFTSLDGDAEFRIIQTNPTPEANRKFASMGPENVTVHRTGTTVYAVVETGNLTVKYRRVLRETQFYSGERFAVQFGYDLPDTWSRATVPSSPIVEFQPASQLTTEQSRTTEKSRTTERPRTTVTTTRTYSKTSSTGSSTTTSEKVTTNGNGGGQTGTPGVPGFTALMTFIALLGLVVLWTQRS